MPDALPAAVLPAADLDPWPEAPTFISLSREAGSPAAVALASAIAAEIEPQLSRSRPLGPAGRRSHRAETAAVLAGMLKAGLRGEAVRAQRGKAGRQWRAAGGSAPPIGYRSFWSKADALAAAGLVQQQGGIRFAGTAGMTGTASRLRCTSALLARAAAAGMTAGTFAADWPLSADAQGRRPEAWGDTVRCMEIPAAKGPAKRTGAFPVDQDARVAAVAAHLDRLNSHLAASTIAGCVPPVLVRKFFSDISLGGRFYAIGSDPYQTMRGEDRRRLLRIDGAPVVEVDLRASVLSVLLAVAGQEIPVDPYAAGPLAAFDRETVKAFFAQALNGGRMPGKWSPDHAAAVRTVPIGYVRAAALQAYPLLQDAAAFLPTDLADKLMARRGELGWGLGQWLVGIEAEIMEAALEQLMERGVVALPLHDAVLCREGDAQEARRSLVESFQRRVGATPWVNVKNACSESLEAPTGMSQEAA